jgi:hypothetical protein
MSDRDLRTLERRALLGDYRDHARLRAARRRVEPPPRVTFPNWRGFETGDLIGGPDGFNYSVLEHRVIAALDLKTANIYGLKGQAFAHLGYSMYGALCPPHHQPRGQGRWRSDLRRVKWRRKRR